MAETILGIEPSVLPPAARFFATPRGHRGTRALGRLGRRGGRKARTTKSRSALRDSAIIRRAQEVRLLYSSHNLIICSPTY